MPISTTSYLLLHGTLFLSPTHPAQIKNPNSSLWLSKSNIIEAQAVGSQVILKAKAPGLVHAVGLNRDSLSPQAIQSVSDSNYRALSRCPQSRIDWSAFPPQLKSVSDAPTLASCGFEGIALPESLSESDTRTLRNIEERLFTSGVRILGIQNDNGLRRIRLSGKPGSQAKRLRRLLGPWSPFYSFEYVEGVRPGRTLIFEVSLFEFSRSKASSLGARWPHGVSFKSLGGAPLSWSAGDIEIGADFGESLGIGRVLAKPQIRTKPGEKASFQSGGEIPIRNTSAYSSQMSWKNYGLLLNLEPEGNTETGAPEITVGFKLELSEPDPSSAIDGVPGMRVRRLESRFDLRTDELTILTTLVQTRSGTQREGLRGFSEVPLIQTLFGKRDRSEQDSELWFAIRPSWEEIRAP